MSTRENSIKKVLLGGDSTNKKIVVGCEINSWMETHQKKKLSFQQYRPPTKTRKQENITLSHNYSNKLVHQLERTLDHRNEEGKQMDKPQAILLKDRKPQQKLSQNSSHLQLRELSFNTIEQPSFKIRQRCNSKGYVLKELRRKIKQQNQLKHFSENRLPAESIVQRIKDLNGRESIDYFQRRYKMLSAASSRTGQRKVLF